MAGLKPKLHISAAGDKPFAGAKRQIGKLNAGLYCTKCGEFFALAVVKPGREAVMAAIEFTCDDDDDPLFECPFCHHQQRRPVTEIVRLQLTEATKRKRPPQTRVH